MLQKVFVSIFIGVFGVIGLAVIIFVNSMDGFHAPPPFFKLFASLIGLAFIAFSGFGISQVWSSEGPPGQQGNYRRNRALRGQGGAGYRCTSCGAALDKDAEVSPHGDVKCTYCGRWFNIHG